MMETRLISADSHVQESKTFYQELISPPYRHRIPHVEYRNGAKYLIVEGRRPRRLDIAESELADEDMEREFRRDPSGGTNIELRLSDIERDGVVGEVIYPNDSLWLFSSPDAEYQMAVARTYNDWAIQVFGHHPDKFAPAALIPMIDLSAAMKELDRVAHLGYRVIVVPIVMSKWPYHLPEYEPFWSAVEDAGVVLSLHARSVDYDPFPDHFGEGDRERGGVLYWLVLGMAQAQDPVTVFTGSGILQGHPRLQFTIAECGAGWLAWLLYALDETVEKKHIWIRPKLQLKPSEYFRRQGHVTFGDDPVALTALEFTGPEPLLWGSDYPHDEGTFPHSVEVVHRTFQGLSAEARHKIVFENAASLYRFSAF